VQRRLSTRLDLDARLRLERRAFTRAAVEDSLRARVLFRLRTRARLGRLAMRPFLSEEIFADTASERLTESRLILGTSLPAGPHADWLVGYLRQDAAVRPSTRSTRASSSASEP
jgi:uncharacterized protein DUF2490